MNTKLYSLCDEWFHFFLSSWVMIMAPDAVRVIKRLINFAWKAICSRSILLECHEWGSDIFVVESCTSTWYPTSAGNMISKPMILILLIYKVVSLTHKLVHTCVSISLLAICLWICNRLFVTVKSFLLLLYPRDAFELCVVIDQ